MTKHPFDGTHDNPRLEHDKRNVECLVRWKRQEIAMDIRDIPNTPHHTTLLRGILELLKGGR